MLAISWRRTSRSISTLRSISCGLGLCGGRSKKPICFSLSAQYQKEQIVIHVRRSHLIDALPFRYPVLSIFLDSSIVSPAARAGARAVVVKVRPTVRRARMRADPMACLLAGRPWTIALYLWRAARV